MTSGKTSSRHIQHRVSSNTKPRVRRWLARRLTRTAVPWSPAARRTERSISIRWHQAFRFPSGLVRASGERENALADARAHAPRDASLAHACLRAPRDARAASARVRMAASPRRIQRATARDLQPESCIDNWRRPPRRLARLGVLVARPRLENIRESHLGPPENTFTLISPPLSPAARRPRHSASRGSTATRRAPLKNFTAQRAKPACTPRVDKKSSNMRESRCRENVWLSCAFECIDIATHWHVPTHTFNTEQTASRFD
jgi:hypothetical protein